MNWFDMLTLTAAALSLLEIVTGRLQAMRWSDHRHSYTVGYVLAVVVILGAGLSIWLRADLGWLDVSVWCIAAHLVLTWGEWRNGPPLEAYRGRPAKARAGDLIPSGFDDGRR